MISVITPCLNEAANLAARAGELARQEHPWEWIVVDGGSADDSVEVARALGAHVLQSARGRGLQLNVGARAAQGKILLFLHADTCIPATALAAITDCLDTPQIVGGHFSIKFSGDHWESRVTERIYRLWLAMFKIYFGDSAIFVRRKTFDEVGGFPVQLILEDDHFVRHLQRTGTTRQLAEHVITSDRRYRGRLGSTLITWMSIIALNQMGISADRLAAFYRPHSEERQT
ncbi:MAG: TIGR04283 family arsenosugar biosynthesis glycosyltransferase [Bradymonadaceae bacterium]